MPSHFAAKYGVKQFIIHIDKLDIVAMIVLTDNHHKVTTQFYA